MEAATIWVGVVPFAAVVQIHVPVRCWLKTADPLHFVQETFSVFRLTSTVVFPAAHEGTQREGSSLAGV